MPKLGGHAKAKGSGGPHVGNKQGFHEGLGQSNNPVAGPGAPGAPAPQGTYNPGVPNPTVQPFLTAEDMMAYAMARQQYEEGLHNLDANYENTAITTGYEKENLEKGRVQGREESSDDMAARGLFRSSVRDADLFDIDATAEMRKVFLDTQLNTQKLNMEAQKTSMQGNWGTYEAGVNQKKVENAAGVQASMPQWAVEPSWTPPQAPKDPKQGGKKPNFQTGNPVPVPGNSKPGKGPNNGGTTAPASASNVPGSGKNSGLQYSRKIMGKLYG